jgi:hypothetical protein
MSISTLRRPRPRPAAAAPFVLVERSQTWQIVDGTPLRVCTVLRRADGAQLRVLVDEDTSRVVGHARRWPAEVAA